MIVESGGSSVLYAYPSMLQMLIENFPEYNWTLDDRQTVPHNYWKDKHLELVKKIKEKYSIEHMEDWYRISKNQLASLRCLSYITRQGGLGNFLQKVYPEYEWDMDKFSVRDKRSRQREMFIHVKKLFPDEEVVEDFVHPLLSRSSGCAIQFDVFIPALRLAFEYQGEHHYQEIPSFGSLELYHSRDIDKLQACADNNISLVVIPYLWDGKSTTLTQYINQQLPSSDFATQKHNPD